MADVEKNSARKPQFKVAVNLRGDNAKPVSFQYWDKDGNEHSAELRAKPTNRALAMVLAKFRCHTAPTHFRVTAIAPRRQSRKKADRTRSNSNAVRLILSAVRDAGRTDRGKILSLANGDFLRLFLAPTEAGKEYVDVDTVQLSPTTLCIKWNGKLIADAAELESLAQRIAAHAKPPWELADYEFDGSETDIRATTASKSSSVSSEQPTQSVAQPTLTDEERQTIERRWQYIQNHPITRVEVLLLLKASVGLDWFRDLLDDCRLNLGRDEHTFRLSHALKRSAEPNTQELPRHLQSPLCSFWEIYPHEAEYWFKEIEPTPRKLKLVAGFDAALPWADLGVASATKLQDLTLFTDVGVSLPPRAFRVGVEEFEMRLVGETFSFSFRLSEHGLDFFHHMVGQAQWEGLANFGGHVDGVQLLESFHRQMFPHEASAKSKKRGIFGGMSGPDGRAISFYPSMPKGFNSTEESKKYSFTISVPREVDSEAAIRDLEAKIRKNPKAPMPYGKLAAHYSEAGRMSDAMECLETAFKKATPMAELRGLMAQLLTEVGRLDEALVQLRAAAALAPKNAMVQTKLGVCLSELERDEEALTHFEIAVQSEPDSAERQFNLSMALAKLRKYPDALTAASCAVRLAPDTPRAERHLGLILSVMGQHADALPHLEKATQLEADCPETHRNYAICLAELNQHDKAVVHFRKSIELDETARLHMALSASLAALERWDEAHAACRRAVELEPSNAHMLHNLASVLAKLGNLQEALEVCGKAAAAGETPRVYSTMSQILSGLGDVFEAENALKKGLSLDPHDAVMQTNLGVLLANRGELGEAIKLFEQMLQDHPDAGVAKQYLERLKKLAES